jgi:Ca2+-binding EF-hand superfamily protein
MSGLTLEREQARKMFDLYDADKDGYIVKDELKKLIRQLADQKGISDDQFEIMLSVANSEFDYSDVDKDGKVNFELECGGILVGTIEFKNYRIMLYTFSTLNISLLLF